MTLLEKLFYVPGIRGQIVLWKKGQGSVFFDTTSVHSITDSYSSDQHDWYFHVATHDTTKIKSRGSIKSAQHFTCLWADIDLANKNTNKYPTTDEVRKLLESLDSVGLKPSCLVHSGNGLHAYWFLDRPYECDDYNRAGKAWIGYLNELLATIVTDRKCIIDQTGDMARILRIPGTVHKTSGKLVKELWCSDTRYDLEKLLSLTDFYSRKQSGGSKKRIEDRVLQNMGMTGTGPPSYIDNITDNCQQVKEFIELEGQVEEPIWYALSGLFPYTSDGLDRFIEISASADAFMDSDRSEEGTMLKIDQWEKASDGPCTCEKLNDVSPGICDQCPHLGKITTPLQLGHSRTVTIEEEPIDIETDIETDDLDTVKSFVPPLPFFFDGNDRLCIDLESRDGTTETKVICHNIVVPYKRIWDEKEKEEFVYFKVQIKHDGWREVGVPLSTMQGSCPAMSVIMGSGALIVGKFSSLMAMYLVSCVRYMQELKSVSKSYSRIGWRGDELDSSDTDRFVLGDYTFYNGGRIKKEGLTDDLARAVKDIHPKGDIDNWRKAVSVLARDGLEPHQLAFMGAFAAPLLHATDYSGILVNLLSRDSGTFKSFTLKLITSVYGEPVFDHVLSRDSVKSIYRKMSNRCDLPIVYDEITSIEQQNLSDLVYGITQGREHDRLNQDSSLRENSAIWRTMMFSTSNSSLDTILGPAHIAERMRLMEMSVQHCAENPPMSDMEAAEIMRIVDENYGVAGMAWIDYISKNRDQIFEESRKMINSLMTVTDSNTDKRFWVSYVALCLVAMKHSYNMGLHSFDQRKLAKYCRSLLGVTTKKVTKDKIALPLQLYNYINENIDTMIVVKYSTPTRRIGEIVTDRIGKTVTMKLEERPMEVMKGVNTMRTLHVDAKRMQEFLTKQRIDFSEFMAEMMHEGYVRSDEMIRRKITLPNGAGYTYITGFTVNLNKFEKKYGETNVSETSRN